MTQHKNEAIRLIQEFKGDDYVHGLGCFDRLGGLAASLGARVSVVTSGMGQEWGVPIHEATLKALHAAGVTPAGDLIAGAKPNAPTGDVLRIAGALSDQDPEAVVVVGGGSGIDAVKAAVAYRTLEDRYPDLGDYFGVGQVSRLLEESGRTLPLVLAVQLASGSAAHLTKYSNVTNLESAQKLLIVDDAVVPPKCLFDYEKTATMSKAFTMDGGLDGISHCLEVFYGVPDGQLDRLRPIALLGIALIVNNLGKACADPCDLDAREALGLGTDLGGYAIMIGGTNGAHLTSFSLVDVLPHGRACALMNPYYTVFFAPAIEDKLRDVGAIYREAGYTAADLERLRGRDLGLAVAEAMLALSRDIGFPTTLGEVEGFTHAHVDRALAAAKNPKLEMKLRNMPVPLSADTVDEYMRPILEAAKTGDFAAIKNM